MKSMVKRILSVVLALSLCLPLLPHVAMPVEAASTGLSLSQLREKFPHGKYWNHAGKPGSSNSVNNQDGYTSTPCSQHGVVGTSKQTCNGFQPSGTQLSWQCMGYAEKLGYDATGYNPRNNANGWYTYTSSSALDNLKPGDIVRYKNNKHSIYVTGVNGDTVTYTDCNSDGHCIIRWDVTISKSTLRSSFTHLRSAPSSVSPGVTSCSCSTSYAGTYICTTSSMNLTIRSGHGSSYSAIGTIPPGATVTVTKASGTSSSDWAHVTYNGVTGYASMQYLSKKQATQQRNSKIGIWFSDSGMGSSIRTIRTGEWLYLCYKLYDANTGDLLDTYNTSGGYTAKLTIYETNGAVAHTYTYTGDNNWIAIKRSTPGNYKGELVFTWNRGGTTTSSVSINMVYEPRVTPSASDIQLNVTGTNSQTINISYSGATSSNSIYLDCTTSGNCFSYKWGSWSDHKMPLTITGVRAGEGSITIELHDSDTDQIIATSKVYVTVAAPTYTVSYNANGGTGVPGSQTKYYNTALTLSGTKPTRTGYTFLGWSTSSSATSASYQPGGSFTSDANTTLYAVWKANSYTVTYNANGGTGVPSSQTKTHGVNLTLSTIKPTRTGYTFLGWSTSSSATSASYQPGGSFTNDANTTLYAVWKANSYTVTYNANGGTGAPSSQTKTHGVNLTLSTIKPTRTGYTFLGWSTSSSATSASYQPGGTFTSNASTTLYAVWKVNTTALSINSINSAVVSGGGEMKYFTFIPTASTQYVIYSTGSDDTKVYLYDASWNQLASNDDGGEGNNFRLEYSLNAGTTYIFAVGYYNPQKTGIITFTLGNIFEVTYNANGGLGAPYAQSKDYGANITLSSTVPTREGYTFLGWSTNWEATSASYKPGSNFSIEADTILYAVWEKGCENGLHNFKPTYVTAPTLTASGEINYACIHCELDYNVSLPKLNVTDYTYEVIKVPTGTNSGIGRYTWNESDYGEIYFDVVLGAYEGLCNVNGEWGYYEDGELNTDFVGVVQAPSGTWYYVKDGTIAWGFTGIAQAPSGTWYYIREGRIAWSFTGIAKAPSGTWYYIRQGRIAWSYTGLAKSPSGRWLYIKAGRVAWSHTGIVQAPSGSWVYVKKGAVDWSFTGIAAAANGKKYYVKKGIVDWTYSGKVTYGGKTYNVVKGAVQ